MFTAFRHVDHFAWVASYASYIPPVVLETQLAEVFAKPEQINARYRLFWLGVGRSDFPLPEAEAFNRMLTDKGIRHTEADHRGRAYLDERPPLPDRDCTALLQVKAS